MPLTLDDALSFEEKNKFMHSAFSNDLETDQDKKIFREYEEHFIAQLVCIESHGFCTTSVGARVNALDMLGHIASSKIES